MKQDDTPTQGEQQVYWVVQRNRKTGTVITFASFANPADAFHHKAKLEAVTDPDATLEKIIIEIVIGPDPPG